MPRTTRVTDIEEIHLLKMFDPSAASILEAAFNEGMKIEKIESSFNDPGDDYVKFTLEGKEALYIPGY